MKKRVILCLLVVLILLLFTACGVSPGLQGEIPTVASKSELVDDDTFWILTVDTIWGQMKHQVYGAEQYFREKYPDLDIKVEYLSHKNASELELRLTQLRVDIMAGKGPDVFILPTQKQLMNDLQYEIGGFRSIELLFPDVNQTIQNGHFLDISEQYDADTELGKESLNTAVMDAGVYKGMRVVLPLRYDLPVYMVDTDRIGESGLELDWLVNTDAFTKMDEAIAANDPILAASAVPGLLDRGHVFSYFYDRLDYATGNIDITEEEMTEFLDKTGALRTLADGTGYYRSTRIQHYLVGGDFLGNVESPVQEMLLAEALDVALMCKTLGVNYTMVPSRMPDGSVVAHVTWYGAVGSSCDDVDLAYDYLRLFLTEEYQWEQNRSSILQTLSDDDSREKMQGMVGAGYPVRDQGAAKYIGRTGLRNLNTSFDGKDAVQRRSAFQGITLTDEDLPFLGCQIDVVRFPSVLERNILEEILYNYDEYHNPVYEDNAAKAKEIVRQLRYQLAEG